MGYEELSMGHRMLIKDEQEVNGNTIMRTVFVWHEKGIRKVLDIHLCTGSLGLPP